ncbi:MAG: DsbA family protein [Chloroflexota bacterium]|nr:MAG: DsbA family protein [Chloroflexota bacterium]
MSNKSSAGKKGPITKREAVREKRRQEQKRKRIFIILAAVAAALIIAALLIYPSFRPVGEIITITPIERPMADGRALGDPNAPVKIEIYEDFQCPACKNFSEQIEPQIVDTYVATGEVYYVFRHFPFLDDQAVRKESDQTANASMCAADENRFWDFHDILFANWNGENQGAFSDNRLVAFAESIGLNMESFNQCFDANTHKDVIDADLQSGKDLGVTGTPSVFVNGKLLTPGLVPSFSEISDAVQAQLNQ